MVEEKRRKLGVGKTGRWGGGVRGSGGVGLRDVLVLALMKDETRLTVRLEVTAVLVTE